MSSQFVARYRAAVALRRVASKMFTAAWDQETGDLGGAIYRLYLRQRAFAERLEQGA